jgi:hypothetical protein
MSNQDSQEPTPMVLNPDLKTCPHCGHGNPSWRSTCENCDQGLNGETNLGKTGKSSKPVDSVDGKCQNCSNRPGKPYSFHYLKFIGTNKKAVYSDYHDAGIQTTILCYPCVQKHRTKEFIQFGFFVLLFLSASFLSLSFFVRLLLERDFFSALLLASGVTTLMLGVVSIWILIKTVRGGVGYSGVSLAMKIWKKWLTEQGYATILYEDEYQKLKAKR